MQWIVFSFYMGLSTVSDWKKRKINLGLTLGVMVVLLGWVILRENVGWKELSLRSMPGILLTVLAIWKKEVVGIGDGLCLIVHGLVWSCLQIVKIMICSMGLLALWGTGLILLKKGKWDTKLPYIPFLSIANVMVLIMTRN